MTTHAMPRRPEQLSAAFLTDVLRAAGALPRGCVTSFELGSVGDAGQTGQVVRVIPQYEDTDDAVPRSLIAKFASAFDQARAQMHALGLYEREVRFYQDFSADAGIPIPRCHYADIDVQSGDFALLLEDLDGGRNGDFWHGSVEDAEIATRHLAAFHAKWWEHPRLRSTTWLRQPDDVAYYRDALSPLLPTFGSMVQAAYPKSFGGYLARMATRLAERWPQFVAAWGALRPTLIHCDYHPKQLFFPCDGRGRFAVFDWQSVCVGPAASDLQRVLLTMLSPAQLADHQARLVQLYHAILTEHGVRHSLDELISETKLSAAWTLWITIFALATTDVSILRRDAEARGADVEQRTLIELGQMLEHMDALSHIP